MLEEEQKRFYEACLQGDQGVRSDFHQRYQKPVEQVLRQHFRSKLDELTRLREQILITKPKSPRLDLIQRHNAFLTGVFQRALDRFATTTTARTTTAGSGKK